MAYGKILAVKKEEVKPTFRLGFEEGDVVSGKVVRIDKDDRSLVIDPGAFSDAAGDYRIEGAPTGTVTVTDLASRPPISAVSIVSTRWSRAPWPCGRRLTSMRASRR